MKCAIAPSRPITGLRWGRPANDPALSALPVLMLASSTSPEDVTRCYDARANAYLEQPTDPVAFGALMESVERFRVERAHLPPVSP